MVPLLRGIGGQATIRALGLVLSIGTVSLSTRYLGADNYGALAVGLAAVGLAFGLADGGLDVTAIRLLAQGAHRRAVMAPLLQIRVILLALSAFLIGLWAFQTQQAQPLVILICLLSVIPYVATTGRVVVEAQRRVIIAGCVYVSQTIAWFLVVLVLVLNQATVESFAAGFIVAVAVQGLVASMVAKAASSTQVEAVADQDVPVRGLLRTASPLMIAGLFTTLYFRGLPLAIASFSDLRQAAYFAIAYRLIDAAQILPMALNSSLLPTLARQAVSAESEERTLWRRTVLASVLSAMILGTIGAGVVYLTTPLIVTILAGGGDFSEAASVIPVVFAAFPLIMLGYVLNAALNSVGSVARLPWVTATAALLGAICAYPLISERGAIGAGLTMIVYEICMCVGMLFLVWRAQKEQE